MKSRKSSMVYCSFLIMYTVQLFAPAAATIALTETTSGATTTSSTPPISQSKPVEKKPAEKAPVGKENADKDKADKEKADKEKADADKDKADKAAADKKIADDKEAADKADKEKTDKEKADKEKADKEDADKKASDDKAAATPKIEVKPKQILISVYIQNNFTKDAQLNQIELLTAKKTEPFIKNNLNIPIPASKSLYSKGSVTAFDLTADRNSIETFNGIQSITINDDKLTFNNIKIGSSLSTPIKITQKDGHWVLDK
jgi:hypothetical protein